MKVKIKKLHRDAIMPEYATDGAGCFDLSALEAGEVRHGELTIIRTGLSFEIPSGFVMLVFSRSGMGFKEGTRLVNCVGVIDSDYRGEVKVGLIRDLEFSAGENGEGGFDYKVKKGDRIAQAIVLPFMQMQFVEADDLSETNRGEAGFGSTGK